MNCQHCHNVIKFYLQGSFNICKDWIWNHIEKSTKNKFYQNLEFSQICDFNNNIIDICVSTRLARERWKDPSDKIRTLFDYANISGLNIVSGCDAHSLWGCTNTNRRSECIFHYLLNSNLTVCNLPDLHLFIFIYLFMFGAHYRFLHFVSVGAKVYKIFNLIDLKYKRKLI